MRRGLRRAWPAARIIIGFGLVGVALWVLSSKTSELEGFGTVFRNFDWWWVPPAVVAEIGSYFCFAAMQFELLKAGHLRAPWSPLVKLTFASQAITNSLPIGNAFSSVYGFRWFRRFGADNTLAVWALVGTLVAASVSLSLLAILGLGVATQEGASLDLVPVLIGTFIVLLGIGSLFVYERPLRAVLSWALRFSVAVTGRPRGDTVALIDRVIAWMTAVRLNWSQIGRIIAWGTLNWLLDCACFAMMFLALDAPIPWTGLLLAYGAGQLAATLPITPGGLGVVEGSITVALVAFGGAETSTAYAVMLYRIISFWMILVVGWLFIGQLALQVRRGRWNREALSSEIEAGPVAYEAPTRRVGRPTTRGCPTPSPEPGCTATGPAPGGRPHPGGLVAGLLLVRPDRLGHRRRLVLPGSADGGQGGRRPRAPRGRAQVQLEQPAQHRPEALRPAGRR